MTQQAPTHPLFPVKMPAQWGAADLFSLSSTLRDWLLDPSSLTARLKANCGEFRVEVL